MNMSEYLNREIENLLQIKDMLASRKRLSGRRLLDLAQRVHAISVELCQQGVIEKHLVASANFYQILADDLPLIPRRHRLEKVIRPKLVALIEMIMAAMRLEDGKSCNLNDSLSACCEEIAV